MDQIISLNEYPSIHWKKFFNRFSEIEILPVEKWDTTLIIAYFCKRYEQCYGKKYSFKFNSTAPNKSYEVFNIRKLANILSAEPNILKDYIDWWYQDKIIAKKKRITSMAYLTDTNIVNEYKFKKLLIGEKSSIDKATIIPPTYSNVVQKYGFTYKNYGELAFVKKCIASGNGDQKHQEMLNELSGLGMDLSVLDRVK